MGEAETATTTVLPHFGALLRRHRLAAGLTQEALAERAGLSARAVSDLERDGARLPRLDSLAHLGDALTLTAAERSTLRAAARPVAEAPASSPQRRTHSAEKPHAPHPGRRRLPLQLTSFVGRTREVKEVRALLGRTRLLTLTGPGGVGKTRLALEAAGGLVADYQDGLWFVDLAPLADPALVARAVGDAAGVAEHAGVPVGATLSEAIANRRILLVLDNCEHLVEACAQLADNLLRACGGLRILATSRELLGTTGEVTWPVPALTLPPADSAPAAVVFAGSEAVRLFAERAAAARPEFELTDANAAAVARICRRLDDVPLAIELAAARVRALSPAQIANRLDDRFSLLTGGNRTALPRHQTLTATVRWSYDLLGGAERVLFRRLSVFAGGWTLEAAEAVCADSLGRDSQPAPQHVFETLARLVDRSLVLADEASGAVRYRFLETIRQYAADKLEDAGESVATRGRHRDWFLAQAEGSQFDFFDPQHVAWLADELDNLRVALRWSIQQAEVEAGLRLANAASAVWHQRGFYAEGRTWFAELPGLPGAAAASEVRAFALIRAAFLATIQGEYAVAQSLHDQSLTLAQRLGYSYGIAQVLLNRGHVARVSGDLAGAQSIWEEGLNVSRSNAYQALEFYYLLLLGLVALEQGDRARAGALGSESLALATQIGHLRGRASSLQVLGRVAAGQGDHAAGRALLEESLALHREHADRDGIEGSLQALAHLSIDQGDASTASRLFAESLTLARDGGARWEIARSLDGLAGVAVETRPDRAVRLAGAASALREVLGVLPQPEDRERLVHWLNAAQRGLGPEAYTAAWAAGRAMPLDHAVALALTQEDDPDQALQAGDLAAKDLFSPLSKREWEVARLVAHGCTNRQIAEQLVIAPRTADTHVGNILSKLDLHSRAELAAWAVTHGLTAARSD